MQTLRKKNKKPETIIQNAVIAMLRSKGWYVTVMHATATLSGWPDLRASHSAFKGRWIEIKLPEMKGSRFTAAQLDRFPKMAANGDPIWILTAATLIEYEKLHKPANLGRYLLAHS